MATGITGYFDLTVTCEQETVGGKFYDVIGHANRIIIKWIGV